MNTDQKILEYLKGSLAGNDWAFTWFVELLKVTDLWDEIADADVDKVNQEKLNEAMEILLYRWVFNPFYQQNKHILTPVMVNAGSAWRASNTKAVPKIKAYDIITEIPCTIYMLIGGFPMVEKFMPKLRELSWEMCQSDDAMDKDKR